jgi:hypothetical protein
MSFWTSVAYDRISLLSIVNSTEALQKAIQNPNYASSSAFRRVAAGYRAEASERLGRFGIQRDCILHGIDTLRGAFKMDGVLPIRDGRRLCANGIEL